MSGVETRSTSLDRIADMTTAAHFARVLHPAPATPEARNAVLAAPGFGKYFTDHMVTIDYAPETGWTDARVEPSR